MKDSFAWLVRHEKLLAALTLTLLLALFVQIRFYRGRVETEASPLVIQEPTTTGRDATTARAAQKSVAGIWEMSLRKKNGGAQIWTLTLAQDGDALKGNINSEGGDLPVAGAIKGNVINLSAKRYGVTVEFPATLEGDEMRGTMRALVVERTWTAKRK
jgi:hypothetical protein